MKTVKAAELVLDFDLYPRSNVDGHNVRRLADALTAGAALPPVLIDKKSRRVVDGFHRVRAHLLLYGEDAELMVVEKSYKNDRDLFLEAVRLNATHGLGLDTQEHTRCILIADRLSIPEDALAGALSMPPDRLGALRVDRTATGPGGLAVPLKRTIRSRAGTQLTERQVEANERLSGMNQQFYANQLIELIEANLLDLDDEALMGRLRTLHGLLDGLLVAK